jgi:hypothetical protein
MIVMIIDAISSATKDRDANPQFPKEISRDPERKKASREVTMASPAAAMPIA